MNSMTGYGKGIAQLNDNSFTIELKSVNHRFLDLSLKLPRQLNVVEDVIKKTINNRLSRGHVDVYVTFEQKTSSLGHYEVDMDLAKNVYEIYDKVANEFNVANDVTASKLLNVPDVVKRTPDDIPDEVLISLAKDATDEALNNLCLMRNNEGNQLKDDIYEKLQTIENLWSEICNIAPKVVEDYKKTVLERVSDLLSEELINNDRIATEVALYADHCAIDEEITRLKAHIDNMRILLEQNEPVGRKMDFLVQEMNRETNTIGSKANDIRITNNILLIKNEIEKIREQIQNIE